MRAPPFLTLANGEPIENYHPEPPPIHVVYSGVFEEIEARNAAGLSQHEYDSLPGTPDWLLDGGPTLSKSHIVAFYRLRNQIESVFMEASKRKAASNG